MLQQKQKKITATQNILNKIENVQQPKIDPLKRAMDITIAIGLLIVFGPIMLIAAVATKITSKGPVIFKQTRVGYQGTPFTIYKFRTMRTDMGHDIHKAFMKKVIEKQQASTKPGEKKIFKMKNDPRITFVGKILRKTSVDELPQIFNVLKGEMSIIGPRPPIQYEVDNYKKWQLERLNAVPGITGLWQVSGRNLTDFETMCKQDIEYIHNRTLKMDLEIIVKTVPAMLKGY